jgi:aspartyl-tRNA(Asn)/glutamyl-tRNA(Gln) amidotransferase subunit A
MYNYSDLSALDLSLAIQNKQTTTVELSQYFIQRIEDHAKLNCISQLLKQRALQHATHLDDLAAQGKYLSPLHGVPIIVKDSFALAGEITWAGTTYLNRLEHQDAAIITQLEALGLVVIARAKMTELAFGLSGQNPLQGTPLNPCYPEIVAPGGSSSGCAVAVAAGLAPIAIGGDTGGSVRVPAAFNGILGFKPSCERLNKQGNVPLAHSLDSVGLMAKSTQDLIVLYGLLQPSRYQTDIQPKLSYLAEADFPELLQPEVLHAWQKTLQQLHRQGYNLSPWQLPEQFNFQQLSQWCSDIIAYEGYQTYAHLAENEDIRMWSVVRQRILRGAQISAQHYQQLIQQRDQYYQKFAASLADDHLLLLPITPSFAPVLNCQDTSCHTVGPYSRPFNYLDVPACSFPIAYGLQGQPIAAQLVAAKGQESVLLHYLQSIMDDLNLYCVDLKATPQKS